MAAASRKFQYKVPNYLFNGYSIATNGPTAGAFRGYGNAQLTFGRELMMSRIARKLHLDPVEFRLRNHVQTGEKFLPPQQRLRAAALKCACRCQKIRREIDEKEGLADNEEIRQAWGVSLPAMDQALPPKKE